MPEGTEGAEQYHAGLYTSEDEAIMAYQTKYITLQDEIWVRRTVKISDASSEFDGETVTGRVKTTSGASSTTGRSRRIWASSSERRRKTTCNTRSPATRRMRTGARRAFPSTRR